MKQVMVQYKVHADKAEENVDYVQKVYEDLKKNSPTGLRYVTFRQPDGVSFVHIAAFDPANGENPLHQSKAFQTFTSKIGDRCEVPPVVVDLEEIGAYGFPS